MCLVLIRLGRTRIAAGPRFKPSEYLGISVIYNEAPIPSKAGVQSASDGFEIASVKNRQKESSESEGQSNETATHLLGV